MPLTVFPEHGETILGQWVYQPNIDAAPYAMAISTKSVFVPAKQRGFVVRDPWYFERIPLRSIHRVSLARTRAWGAWVVGTALIVGGLIATFYMMLPVMSGEGGVVRAAPAFGVLFGFYMLIAAKGRRAIVLEIPTRPIRLAPPTSLGSVNKEEIHRIQEAFLAACSQAGLPVQRDSRAA